MGSSTASTSKETWRAKFRTYRRSLGTRAYAARSSLIGQRTLGLPAVTQAQVVHVYWPLPVQREIDTRPLIGTLCAKGIDVVLPVVTSFAPDTPTMEHRRYTGPDALVPNRWGIYEPVSTTPVTVAALDVVLVPTLGADQKGQRLGHGSGYYDAFLRDVSCPRIALVYEACVVPTLPKASHDVPMTTLVTEQTVIDI